MTHTSYHTCGQSSQWKPTYRTSKKSVSCTSPMQQRKDLHTFSSDACFTVKHNSPGIATQTSLKSQKDAVGIEKDVKKRTGKLLHAADTSTSGAGTCAQRQVKSNADVVFMLVRSKCSLLLG